MVYDKRYGIKYFRDVFQLETEYIILDVSYMTKSAISHMIHIALIFLSRGYWES